MSLVKFNSSKPAERPFDSFLNDFFEGEFFPSRPAGTRLGTVPHANIKETGEAYHVELAAPGMKKEDFRVELNDELLTIRAERKLENEEKKERYTKREFNFTSFVRSFRLPEEVEVEKIAAAYQDGILTIEIPKVESKAKVKVREISVN
jgi:HSP20 family protein